MDNRDEGFILLESIRERLSKLPENMLLYGAVGIYKVPEKHRNRNQEAFTPRLISIGFVHEGKPHLQAMEEYKWGYLNHFLHASKVPVAELVAYVKAKEKDVCGCYEEIYVQNIQKRGKVPPEVLLLDAVFIVVLFLKNHFFEMRQIGDIVFDNPSVSNDVLHDLLLLENQLPFTFLSELYDRFVLSTERKFLENAATHRPPFIKLVHKYFKCVCRTEEALMIRNFQNARHLVEFLSILHRPPLIVGKVHISVKNSLDSTKCPSATELKAAGVMFRQGTCISLVDVRFEKNIGVMMIPALTVSDSTETFFYNLIAFEQSGYHSKNITSYVVLLGNLIKTHKDVDLLIECNILRNEYGSSEKVSHLFSNLYKDLVVSALDFQFLELCYQLKNYSRNWFLKLNAMFARTPIIQAIGVAALVGTILGVIETVCSILQVTNPK